MQIFSIEFLIVLEKLLQYFGSVTSQNGNTGASSVDTDTIAGETTSSSGSSSGSSTNIDVVGLAVFKGDVLIRWTYFYRCSLSFNYY